MPHELTIRDDGKAEMFYYGETPWHGLGAKVDNALTAFEAIEAAGLNWTVSKEPLYRADGSETPAYITKRDDTGAFLGIVSKSYRVIQNHEAFSLLDSLTMSAEAKYHTAGSLRGGKRVWMLAKLPGQMSVMQDDLIDKYLLLVSGHDSRVALRIMFTPVRVVCQNTLLLALRSARTFVRVPHCQGDMEKRIKDARIVLGLATSYFEEQEDAYKAFAKKEIREKDLDDYFESLFPSKDAEGKEIDNSKVLNMLHRLHSEGAGSEWSEGTLWGAYNAVVEYVDHYRVSYESSPEKYLSGIIFGEGLAIKTNAHKKAVALLK